MNDFDYDVFQKKRIASGSRYVRRGSRSKRCSLPHDHITEKQWKEMNGEMETFSMKRPMAWSSFKSMSPDLQVEYLQYLITEFNATQGEIADMFDVSRATLCKHVKNYASSVKFDMSRRMSKKNQEDWLFFLTGETPNEEKEMSTEAEPCAPEIQVVNEIANDKKQMLLREFTLHFSGHPDVETIRNSLKLMLSGSEEVDIHISVQVTA